LASSRQYGNALLGVRHQEEEEGAVMLCGWDGDRRIAGLKLYWPCVQGVQPPEKPGQV